MEPLHGDDEEGKKRLKLDLENAFQAWYDHKMDPGNAEALRVHQATIDIVKAFFESEGSAHLSRSDVRQALRDRFRQWMKENRLPPLPK